MCQSASIVDLVLATFLLGYSMVLLLPIVCTLPHCLLSSLFEDDAVVVSHAEEGLQNLITRFSNVWKEFGLTISIKKTQEMGPNTTNPPVITID